MLIPELEVAIPFVFVPFVSALGAVPFVEPGRGRYIDDVREEMELAEEDGEEGASWRKDSMNCWIWRLS